MNVIKQYSYYIIRIDNSKLHKSYFKIGETDNSKRPDNLCKEYEQKSANKAYKILQDKLPVSGHKRLNDKKIHAEFEKNGIIRTNPYEFEVEVSSDGKAEIFEFNGMTDADVIEYVKNTVSELAKDKSNYTASIKIKTYDNEAYNKHIVNANLINEIEKIAGRIAGKKINNNILLIGQFDHEWKIMCCATNNLYIMHDSPDNKKLHDYMLINEKITYINDIQEIIEKNMKFDIIIANPPYGRIGAEITKSIIDNVEFDEYVNLQPGNDYFINDMYKHITNSDKPIIIKNGFDDAAQITTISKLDKEENNFTQIEARIELGIFNNDKCVYQAIKEFLIKSNTNTPLKFTQSKRDLKYDENTFVFNPGAFDICHGYFAIYDKGRAKDWTKSTKYNIYKKDAYGSINLPNAIINGCLQFKKLIYSEIGLKLLKLLFSSSPEGWGFSGKHNTGMFADIDYRDCHTWYNVFDKLGISKTSQDILISAANKFSLTDKEKEICEISKTIL